jgi:putative NADH-flavin reductase
VRQAIAAGHEVTAVVRDPTKLPADERLEVVVADIMEPASIADAVANRDAVVSSMGSREGLKPTSVCEDSARSIVEAMHRTGSKRLVVVSGSGPFVEGDGFVMRYIAKPIAGRILKHGFADFVAMETVVRASGLDWTIVRPPRLTDKPVTGRYRTRADLNLRRGLTLPRSDLAHMILASLDDADMYGATLFVAT